MIMNQLLTTMRMNRVTAKRQWAVTHSCWFSIDY